MKVMESFKFTRLLKLIIKSPIFKNADFSNFDLLVTGGVCVPESFRKIFRKKLTNVKLVIANGTSKSGGITKSTIGNSSSSTSIGVPLVNADMMEQQVSLTKLVKF